MEALQHQGAAAAHLGQDAVVGGLILGASTGASAPREAGGREHRPVLGHSKERRAQASAGHELVDGARVEQIGEVLIEVAPPREQQGSAPMRGGECGCITGNAPAQRRETVAG
jgi:hypothetical protein